MGLLCFILIIPQALKLSTWDHFLSLSFKTMIMHIKYYLLLFSLYLVLLLNNAARQKFGREFSSKSFSQITPLKSNYSDAVALISPQSKVISKKLENVDHHSSHFEGAVTYVPGLLNVTENGLKLSAGLKSRLIAQSKAYVKYSNGKQSKSKFHGRPDGAAVFSVKEGANAGG